MIPLLVISYREVPGFAQGLHRVGDGSVIVCSGGLTSDSKQEEFSGAVNRISEMITTGVHLPAIPRAVVYFGLQLRSETEALVRELLSRQAVEIVACPCDFQGAQLFAMGHGLQVTRGECDGAGPTMSRIIAEASRRH